MITQNARLLSFLNELRRGKIYYRMSQHRDDAIMVEVAVPGDREQLAEVLWESLDEGGAQELDAAALDEVRRRSASIDDGTATTKSVDEVVERLRRKARP